MQPQEMELQSVRKTKFGVPDILLFRDVSHVNYSNY